MKHNQIRIKKPLISVIIVNYNGKHLLKRVIESLKKQNFSGGMEIIVVDNDSTDGSRNFIKKNYKYVKWVQNKENLSYPGANSGIKAASGDYVLFTNNDVEFKNDCISKMYNVLANDKSIGMTVPKLINYYNRKIDSKGTWVSRSFYCGHLTYGSDDKLKIVPYMGIGLLGMDIIRKLGYMLDIDYFLYAEDLDLCLRLRLLGYNVVYVPDAIIYHVHSATMDKYSTSARKTFLLEKNLLTTFFKICSFNNILILLPYVISMRFILMLKDLITFKFNIFFARLKALFWVIFNVRKIYRKRKHVQTIRKRSDKFLFKVFNEKEMLMAMKNAPI